MHQDESGGVRLLTIMTKCLVWPALPFLAWGYGAQLFHILGTLSMRSSAVRYSLVGVAAFLPVAWVMRRYLWKPWEFVCTLEHEVTHAVAGLPFLLFPRGMRVTATEGGHLRQFWYGPLWLAPLCGPGTLFSGLAPYFLPTVSYAMIGLSLLFSWQTPWVSMTLGFVTAFHVVSTWLETRYHQPDIRQAGFVFSTVFLP
ncbi:MAG TPA: hypothetical protein VF508_12300, partial [Pyrinomonadaceae bacterium]